MKEGLDSFIDRVKDQFPEVDTKRKFLKYLLFFIKTKTFGWSTQSGFRSAQNVLNDSVLF